MNHAQKHFAEGTPIGSHYLVERLLGVGGMGSAYLCMDSAGGEKRFVVKILNPDKCSPGTGVVSSGKFSFLRRLRHPNLIHITDFGMLEGSEELFLVHEWIEGKDLLAGTESMEIDQVLDLMADLAKALQYLHTRTIIHGNLNPSNIFLSQEDSGLLKIMDYGLTRPAQSAQRGNGAGMLAYTAPEILLGGTADKRSDLYSLGILFYQLLTRRLPFEDADPGFLMQKHLQGTVELRSIERMHGGIYLSKLLRSLLEKNPAKRAASGEEVIRLIGSGLGRDRALTNVKELQNNLSVSQFVGRENEMSRLKECLQRVRASGRGWTIFITGEAGSGKTRCMEELQGWAVFNGWNVVEGKCRVREEGSYSPYRQILANCEPADGESLFHFKEMPRAAGVFESRSEFAAGQFRDLLTRELVRRLTGRPTLLLLDDFHLADEATNAVLDYLSSDIQAHPVLMCIGLRSGKDVREALERVMDSVIRQERGEILALDPLTKANVENLIAGMTGDLRLGLSLGSWIFRSFGGNPFLIEEVLKHLVEQGLLIRESGNWRIAEGDLERLEVPASVGSVLRKRLDQLSLSARELANWLGLFESAVPVSLLDFAVGRDARFVSETLEELNQRQMIQTETQGADAAVEFRHPLIAEVIRGDLPSKRRQNMHRRIAEAIAWKYGDDGHIQELAMHYIEGNSGSIAVRYALIAAAQSRAEFAHEKARYYFEHVFKCRRGLTEEQLCEAAIEASDTMFALGFPKRSIRLLKHEISDCKSIRGELRARMYMQLALSYQHIGDLRMQEKCCKKGLSLFRGRSASEINMTKASLLAELAFAAILQSHSRKGRIYLDKARKACPEKNAAALKGRIFSLSASLHRIAGNLHEALSASESAADVLGESQESYLACSAYSTQGGISAGLGLFPLALKRHAQAVSLSDKSRSVVLRSQALANLAECLCRMGRILEATNAADLASKSVGEANNPAIAYAFNAILAEVKLAAGDYRYANQIVKELNQNAKHNQTIYSVGHALYVAANLGFILGDFDASVKYAEQLRRLKKREAPFYEGELTEALCTRILAERGYDHQALTLLRSLEREVERKHWPYQACIVKLHICEVFVKQRRLDVAERYARNALELADSMASASLISHARLLLGIIFSPVHDWDSSTSQSCREPLSGRDMMRAEKAVEHLKQACQMADNSHLIDTAWRAHAQLSLLLNSMPGGNRYLDHARRSYELLCKIEEQVPSDMLPLYWGAFGRSRVKERLVRLIESGIDEENASIRVADICDEDKARILLRMSSTLNSIEKLNLLLESILDHLIHAMNVERAFIFLCDDRNGSLHYASGRSAGRETLMRAERLNRNILAEVVRSGRPIVSANIQDDPRLTQRDSTAPDWTGKLLCAPLKLADRVLGALYADDSSPAGSFSESAISLFEAFCNLAAIAIDNALANQRLAKEKAALENYVHQAREGYEEIVGESAPIELLRDRIGLAAYSPLNILIIGESGVGKELVAKAIHRTGRRKDGKFVAVDCGALADGLAEADLFGFRKGTFTGAAENRQGLIEAADGGVLFLDEIANMPMRLQAKLLRVIEEREVRRLGETAPRKVDFQLIAATNRDLLEEVRDRSFRDDLYYRLSAFDIRVPPLRERIADIPLLVSSFLDGVGEPGHATSKSFSPEAQRVLASYPYPGNVRELKNIVVRSFYSAHKAIIGIEDLPPEVRGGVVPAYSTELSMADRIYHEILEKRGDFDSLVKGPFYQHQFGSHVVRSVIEAALKDSAGRYRDAFGLLRIPQSRYSAILQFLKHHKCYLDFRPFRRQNRADKI